MATEQLPLFRKETQTPQSSYSIKSAKGVDGSPLQIDDEVQLVVRGKVVGINFARNKFGFPIRVHEIEAKTVVVSEMPVRGLLEAVADEVNAGALNKDGIKVTASVG